MNRALVRASQGTARLSRATATADQVETRILRAMRKIGATALTNIRTLNTWPMRIAEGPPVKR